jgi:hypothetical protein
MKKLTNKVIINQQQLFFFLLAITCCAFYYYVFALRTILSLPLDWFGIDRWAFVFSYRCLDVPVSVASGNKAATYLKNYWTFNPVFALTSLNITWFYYANFWPYYSVTSRSYLSTLLARIAMIAPSPLWCFTSSIHFCMFRNDVRLVTS